MQPTFCDGPPVAAQNNSFFSFSKSRNLEPLLICKIQLVCCFSDDYFFFAGSKKIRYMASFRKNGESNVMIEVFFYGTGGNYFYAINVSIFP